MQLKIKEMVLQVPKVQTSIKLSNISRLRIIILIILDIVSLGLAAWRVGHLEPVSSMSSLIGFFPLATTITIGTIASFRLYSEETRRNDYVGLIKAISLSVILLLLVNFLYSPIHLISRSGFILFWAFSIVFICSCRFSFNVIAHLIHEQDAFRYPVLLISDLQDQEKNIRLVKRQSRYNILGILDTSSLEKENWKSTLETFQNLEVTKAFVSWNSIKDHLYLCWYFQKAGITLKILPRPEEPFLPSFEFEMVGNAPCLTISTLKIVGLNLWIKRSFDIVASLIILTLLSPLFLAIAVLIKLDSPGPIFFKQTRVGLHNSRFQMWKFRTMVTNADQLQKELEQQNEMKDGILFKMKNDPRITRIGKTLRRYSLDELPQLINVLLGNMSLIGPRPLPVRDVEKFHERHYFRHEVLPGMTGLWQVSGRSEIDTFDDVVNLDITYIMNWSIWLDLRIILQTVKVVLQKRGAY